MCGNNNNNNPDLAGSGTLPSVIFSARITFRSQQRTPKPKSSCSKQVMATGIASLRGRSAPTKEHQNINSSTFLQRGTDCSDRESDQRTHKPKFSSLATGIACSGGRSAPAKEHQNIDCSRSLTLARDG